MRCPYCGSSKVSIILYGRISKEMMEKLKKTDVIWGTCLLGKYGYNCKKCKKGFGSLNKEYENDLKNALKGVF